MHWQYLRQMDSQAAKALAQKIQQAEHAPMNPPLVFQRYHNHLDFNEMRRVRRILLARSKIFTTELSYTYEMLTCDFGHWGFRSVTPRGTIDEYACR